MRAVAVIAVITYHMEHAWLPGGFTGVDVFFDFVISGFVVHGSLLRERAPSGGSGERSYPHQDVGVVNEHVPTPGG
eukprot:3080715-Prymnesium_polylepis.1